MPLTIEVTQGDITSCEVDAIVNAANNEFWMGSGVAGAIKAVGGSIIEKEAMKKGPVMPGEAVFTGAGRLPVRYVIHAAVMGQSLKTDREIIRRATVACLVLADKLGVESIAMPAFGTGVGGFPMTACANIMTSTVHGYSALAGSLGRVRFCLFDSTARKLFADALEKILSVS